MTDEATKLEFGQDEKATTDRYDWARELVATSAWVLHVPTRSVAKAKAFHDGVTSHGTNAIDGKPCKGPVLELNDGSSLVAKVEEAFVELGPDEVQFYLAAQRRIGASAKASAELAASSGLREVTGLLLLGVALRQTASVVELAHANAATRANRPKVDSGPSAHQVEQEGAEVK